MTDKSSRAVSSFLMPTWKEGGFVPSFPARDLRVTLIGLA